jgi:MFS family permease
MPPCPVFTLGTASLAMSRALFAMDWLPVFAVGIVLTGFATACVDVTSQLYLLDHASRQALRHFEPTRIFSSAAPWPFGPWLGVYLQENASSLPPLRFSWSSCFVCSVWAVARPLPPRFGAAFSKL